MFPAEVDGGPRRRDGGAVERRERRRARWPWRASCGAGGLRVDVYPDADKLGKQFKYASERRSRSWSSWATRSGRPGGHGQGPAQRASRSARSRVPMSRSPYSSSGLSGAGPGAARIRLNWLAREAVPPFRSLSPEPVARSLSTPWILSEIFVARTPAAPCARRTSGSRSFFSAGFRPSATSDRCCSSTCATATA